LRFWTDNPYTSDAVEPRADGERRAGKNHSLVKEPRHPTAPSSTIEHGDGARLIKPPERRILAGRFADQANAAPAM